MKYILILAIFLTGCSPIFLCRDGKLYREVGIGTGIYQSFNNELCIEGKE